MLGLGQIQSSMVLTHSGDEVMEDVAMSTPRAADLPNTTVAMESLTQRFDTTLHLSASVSASSNHIARQSVSVSSCAAASSNSIYSVYPQPQILPRRTSALILPPHPSPDLSLPHHQRGGGVDSSSPSDCPSVHLLSDDGHTQIPLRAVPSSGRTATASTKPSSHARTSASDLPIAELLRLLFPLASSSASARTMSGSTNSTHRHRHDRSVTPPTSHFARGSCAPPSSPIFASSLHLSSFTPPTNAPPNSPLSLPPAFAASAGDMDDDVRMTGSSSPTRGFSDDMMVMDLGPPSIPHPASFPPHPPTPPTPTPTVSDLHLAMSQYTHASIPSLGSNLSGCGYGLGLGAPPCSMPSTGLESPVMSHALGVNSMMHLPASPPLSPKCASATPKTTTKRKPAAAAPVASSPPTTLSSYHGKSHYSRKHRPSRSHSSSASSHALAVLSGVSTSSTSAIAKRTVAAASSSASLAAPSGAEKVRQQRRVRAMVKNLARQLDGLSMD